MNHKTMKGTVVLNREMTTQHGMLTAKKGTKLVSVFLGSVRDGDDPVPDERMESMGWRQMAMFECVVRVLQSDGDEREWRLAFSCLGAVDAVEAAIRLANKVVADDFSRAEPNTPAPFLASLTVGTITIGPIAEDGTPFNGRGSTFFGWSRGRGVSLEAHLNGLREQAQRHAL